MKASRSGMDILVSFNLPDYIHLLTAAVEVHFQEVGQEKNTITE